ncbi:MAG: two-component system, NtrC family, response regulator AtoC [Thermodesulfobacteriota bacterium]|nr:two-component system, NtrC family, response regulator AtoC [Thermodesulfobacteriota bacterium]
MILNSRVLVIDDQPSILESMQIFFRLRGWEPYTAVTGPEGLRLAGDVKPSLVVLDLRLPGMNGLEVLEQLRSRLPDTSVIMITAYQDMESTIQATKLGAFDYIHKPIDINEMDAVLKRLEQSAALGDQSDSDTHEHDHFLQKDNSQIVARSRGMKDVFRTIGLVSDSRVTVLVQGESGTGKELIARNIHCNSLWSDRPFTVMDCSTFVETLMESELFGHEKGAFTGAHEKRRGRLELTAEGTVFFDEIGELPLQLQSKLLRFLQEREFVRVGGNRPIHSSARIIAATNRDLTKLVQERRFREDLYYRLKVVTIDVPPLRRRKSDIPVLSSYFLKKIAYRDGSKPKRLAPEALKVLLDYDWPGNVRQLENMLTRAVVMTRSTVLTGEHTAACLEDSPGVGISLDTDQSLESVERDHIQSVLAGHRWHLGKVCAQLGISRPTLRSRMRKYGISKT